MLEASGARRELVYGTDFLVQPTSIGRASTLAAGLVFVGFGLSLPVHG